MLAMQHHTKERSLSAHRIHNFLDMIENRAQHLVTFINEESSLKKEELAVIDGLKSIKPSEKKKPTDVIWQNFYDKAKELRDQYKKQEHTPVVPRNTVEYYRENVFQAPFKEPEFSS